MSVIWTLVAKNANCWASSDVHATSCSWLTLVMQTELNLMVSTTSCPERHSPNASHSGRSLRNLCWLRRLCKTTVGWLLSGQTKHTGTRVHISGSSGQNQQWKGWRCAPSSLQRTETAMVKYIQCYWNQDLELYFSIADYSFSQPTLIFWRLTL